MSFIAGYLLGLADAPEYKNEVKNINSNGVFVPDKKIRWEQVNVNVPDRYKDGLDDMEKIRDIIDGKSDPLDVPDDGDGDGDGGDGGGNYHFPDGGLPADDDDAGDIAMRFKDTAVITDTNSGLYAIMSCEYFGLPGAGEMRCIFKVYDARTGDLLENERPNWFWRSDSETFEFCDITVENGYLSVTWVAHTIYGDSYLTRGYFMGASASHYHVSHSAPVYSKD